jgi:hypothetical protein
MTLVTDAHAPTAGLLLAGDHGGVVTLDPVHFEGIARLARRISQDVDDTDHEAFAERVWDEMLDPLVDGGTTLLEPLGEQRRHRVDAETVALADPGFGEVHGLDAGTITPTTFKNGLTMDLAHAAMAAAPSDLDLHRGRSVVAAVHSADATARVLHEDWTVEDDGYFRSKTVQAPRVSRFSERVVSALALYLAESEHALSNADVVDELLVLDGPIYPKAMLRWTDRDPELAELLREADLPRTVVENYLALVERFVERDVPLVGLVKNPASKSITRAVRSKGANAPWVDDATFFARVLDPDPEAAPGERDTDELTCTNWFRSRGGPDRVVSEAGDALGLERSMPAEDYEVAFAAVYDPRDDLTYRVEAPVGLVRDEDRRERLLRYVLSEVAAERGPPKPVAKADELARIGSDERASVREELADAFDTERKRAYDEKRWGVV